MDQLRQHLSLALRGIRRSPGFTAMVVLTIALGVGANGAMFSFLDRIFVRVPDGVAAPAEVRRLYVRAHDTHNPGAFWAYASFEYPHYAAILAANPDTPIAVYETDDVRIRDGSASFSGTAAWVSSNYFKLLGVKAVRGRLFGPDEARVETPTPVAIISHSVWTSRFGSDSSIVGRTIELDKQPYTIIGVVAPTFTGVDVNTVEVFAPLNMDRSGGQLGEPWYRSFNASFKLLARVHEGDRVEPLLARSTIAYDNAPRIKGFRFDTTATLLAGPIVEALGPGMQQREVAIGLRVAGVAAALLFIACANVATLLLVRATRQRREIALRLALGASRGHIYAQSFTESILLALLGGVCAMAVAWWGGTALRALLLPRVNWSSGVLDSSVLLATGAMTLMVGLVSGMAPVSLVRRRSVVDAMKGGARDGVYQRSLLRTGLLVVQTALSVVLVVGSGLFVRSLGNVRAVQVGYDVDAVMFASLSDDDVKKRSPAELISAMDMVEARMAGVPGVVSVARARGGPMNTWWSSLVVGVPGRDSMPMIAGDLPYPSYDSVSSTYFATVGMHMMAGRGFATRESSNVVIVNATMAKTIWPGESAIGKCLILGNKDRTCATVIGVVSDAHRFRIIETASMNYYLPSNAGTAVILRVDPRQRTSVSARVRREMTVLFPGAESIEVNGLANSFERELRPWRLGASLFVAFAGLALLVAAIGVYSVLAYAVTQRTHEMGVRIALGAQLTDMVRLIVGDGIGVVAIGVALGVAVAMALGRVVASLLYGVTPQDPVVLVGAASILVLVGVMASLLPALRASRVDPVVALRAE